MFKDLWGSTLILSVPSFNSVWRSIWDCASESARTMNPSHDLVRLLVLIGPIASSSEVWILRILEEPLVLI